MIERLDHLRLSERSVLRKGTRFRASDGPLFRLNDGTLLPLRARGPFTFSAYVHADGFDYIEALDRDGCGAILHITGERPPPTPEIVTRPYRIRSTIRQKKPRRK